MTTTAKQIKNFTGTDTWKVVCACNRTHTKAWFDMSIEEYVEMLERDGLDFGNQAHLRKLNHRLLND
jgi:hypothetical protein